MEWTVLEAISHAVRPFYRATVLLSSRDSRTLSSQFICIQTLKMFLTTTESENALAEFILENDHVDGENFFKLLLHLKKNC
jgi:hypothetical protein